MTSSDHPSAILPGNISLRLPDQPVRVIGIDLGTTNSTMSEIVWDPGSKALPRPRLIEVEQPTLEGTYTHVLVPSAVAIHDGRIFVGEGAKRLRSRAHELGLERGRDVFYECKNDVGISRTYHRAPEGFRNAAEIGGHVVRFMVSAAMAEDSTPIDRVVVTVPASFQLAQRHDTIQAMSLAGLDVAPGDLIDEPVAAFLDYLLTGSEEAPTFGSQQNLVVFDFGGGTCDVAVMTVGGSSAGNQLEIAPRAVSRYHRLGGGDLDTAIVHDELIPQLLEKNDLGEFDLGFAAKKHRLEPNLLGLAEGLKEGLCAEIRRLRSFDKYEAEKEDVVRRLPDTRTIAVDGHDLVLETPQLSATRFEELLEAFLDQDLLYPKETEYRWTCSIFAPLSDALDRSDLGRDEVDLCLMVGGSSLIPQVQDAVAEFFEDAEVLHYQGQDDVKACVSRGAAWQALSLALGGSGLMRPVCPEAIAIRTSQGPVELVPRGASLPFPSNDGTAFNRDLRVPETKIDEALQLRVDVVALPDERPLLTKIGTLDPPVFAEDELELCYSVDENQKLDIAVTHGDGDGAQIIELEVERPLTNVVNPQSKKLHIEETEERLRSGEITGAAVVVTMGMLADDYREVGQREKALEYYSRVLRASSRPDAGILNSMAILCGEIGDYKRQEKLYLEAADVSSWTGPLFNLALARKRHNDIPGAVEAMDRALEQSREGAYLTFRAQLAEKEGDRRLHGELLEEAIRAFDPLPKIDDWDLSWLTVALQMNGDDGALADAEEEQRRRARNKGVNVDPGGVLPDLRAGRIARMEE